MSIQECGEYYMRTGKYPPVNQRTWVAVYLLLTGAGFAEAGFAIK